MTFQSPIKDVAKVALGPALRRGVLNKGGAETVGGVVVVRYGYNPLQAIKNVKEKINEIEKGLPTHVIIDYGIVSRTRSRGLRPGSMVSTHLMKPNPNILAGQNILEDWTKKDWPSWATLSQVKIVPFYDRTGLINETLGTLNTALYEEILVTILVTYCLCLAPSQFDIDKRATSFGRIDVFRGDEGIWGRGQYRCAIRNRNRHRNNGRYGDRIMRKHSEKAGCCRHLKTTNWKLYYRASSEVGSAVLTAVATTVVSFLPVFTMVGAEGKLFRPLAYTKTFALIASVIVALTIIPPMAHVLFAGKFNSGQIKRYCGYFLAVSGCIVVDDYGLVDCPHHHNCDCMFSRFWRSDSRNNTGVFAVDRKRVSSGIRSFVVNDRVASTWSRERAVPQSGFCRCTHRRSVIILSTLPTVRLSAFVTLVLESQTPISDGPSHTFDSRRMCVARV